jgi:DNA repair exonuclease SbcCD nuclease subunit
MLSKDENQDLIKHMKFIEESSGLIGSDNYFNNIKSIIPEYITSFKEIKLNKNKKLNDGDYFNEFNKLTCIFLKIQNADLINIRHILKSDMIKLKYKTLEIQNSVKEVEREMTIVVKEKKEIFTEKSNIENEIFKYRVSLYLYNNLSRIMMNHIYYLRNRNPISLTIRENQPLLSLLFIKII